MRHQTSSVAYMLQQTHNRAPYHAIERLSLASVGSGQLSHAISSSKPCTMNPRSAWPTTLPVSVNVLHGRACKWPLAQQLLYSVYVQHLLLQQRLGHSFHKVLLLAEKRDSPLISAVNERPNLQTVSGKTQQRCSKAAASCIACCMFPQCM